MNLNQKINLISDWQQCIINTPEAEKFNLFDRMRHQNSWFTPDQSALALEGIINYLDPEKIRPWLSQYDLSDAMSEPRNIGIVMAGNIPGVGFHDLLCVLLSGHHAKIKLSSSDNVMIPWLRARLRDVSESWAQTISFEERLNGMDAYIATGSDNSARYFDYYFGRYPHIIRKNRTAVAILDGQECPEDWDLLAKDIFQYFGLGCRNVSKIYVPGESSLIAFLEGMDTAHQVIEHHKYLNNYEYNKSKLLVNRTAHLDNGHLLLEESQQFVSPIAVVYYEYYSDVKALEKQLTEAADKIQCLVSRNAWFEGSIPMGKAQRPEVYDYADKVDTMAFLSNLEKEIRKRAADPQKHG
ncbi:Acyl-CoA reductase (LuxC) [Cyclobacterium lianum]|uniref:Acyl-CoA reductase (LuxC) n=1 Tax=Cyclobacterium lianum TaxID=388280 RepID=A0A1M7PDS2_9BACT|nr:acyl-CoA reductase [Cyclobacterium lianum]SHN14787.1 Acyl-CoA reductase (LuxC) [Cyclobacterium lianum]